MTGNDILEMILERNGGNIVDTIEDANELLNRLFNDVAKLSHELAEELEAESLSQNKCCLCGCDLETIRELEYSEYQGRSVAEEIHTLQCSDTGCTYIAGE